MKEKLTSQWVSFCYTNGASKKVYTVNFRIDDINFFEYTKVLNNRFTIHMNINNIYKEYTVDEATFLRICDELKIHYED